MRRIADVSRWLVRGDEADSSSQNYEIFKDNTNMNTIILVFR